MWAKVDHHLLLPLAKDQGVRESRHSGSNLDRTTACVVHDAILEGPAVGIPGPACYGAVDKGGPEEDEDHHGHQAAAFGDCSDNDGSCSGAELQLLTCAIY